MEKKVKVTVYMSEKDHQNLRQLSFDTNRSQSELLIEAFKLFNKGNVDGTKQKTT